MKTQLLLAISQTLLICVLITLTFVNGILINRKRTGVIFSPYVDRNTNISYAEEDIRQMLKLVATKFSMIATYGDATDEHFFPKRFHKTAAKVAAKINAESKQPLLKVLLGIRVYNENRVSIFNAAKKANKIYNGTVVALVVHHSDIGNERSSCATQQAVNIVKKVKKEAHIIGLKVGIRHMHNCLSEQNKLLREMAKECDFIVCHIEPPTQILKSRSEEAFGYVGTDLLSKRDYFKEINPSIEVMGETGFPSQGFKFDTWHNVENMKIYWESANKWATQNNFTMWMFEAFDNPWRVNRANGWYPLSGNSGWWKLRRNRYVGMPDAFVEKISESPSELLEKVDEYSLKNTNNFEITKSPPIWVEVGVIFAGLLVIAFVTNFVLLKLKIKRLKGKLSKADLDEFINGISEDSNKEVENAVKFPYDKSFEIPKERLKIDHDKLLGTGQFGLVFRALLLGEKEDDNTEVAVKMPKYNCAANTLKSFLYEIKILTFIGKHPNIVCIIGSYTNELARGNVYIVTELCEQGSLRNFLRNSETKNMATVQNMMRWSHEISAGMEYLTSKNVVHADLATRNVLLGLEKVAKITDFGLSRHLYNYTNYVKTQQEPMPWRWMAVESLRNLEFSTKSDVWSYGVTLWEIFSMGHLPYPGLAWDVEFVDKLTAGLRMKCPENGTKEIFNLMESCWLLDPDKRPTFNELKLVTSELLQQCVEVELEHLEEKSENSPPIYTSLYL